MAILAGLYAVLAIYNLIQAIESLRPRRAQPYVHYSADTGGYEEYPLGLRFYEDVLSRDMEAYRQAWRDVRIGQLNNEVAVQLHAISAIIRAKYAALDRLYRGLQLMVVFAVVLLLMGTGFIFHSKGQRLRLKKNALLGMGAEKRRRRRPAIFAEPQRDRRLRGEGAVGGGLPPGPRPHLRGRRRGHPGGAGRGRASGSTPVPSRATSRTWPCTRPAATWCSSRSRSRS